MNSLPVNQYAAVMLDSINEGVFTVDSDWRITTFNKAAERITGIARSDAYGKLCWDVFHASLCEKSCALKQTMASGKPVINALAHVIDIHGKRIPIRLSTALLKDPQGRVIGGVETFQDLSQVEQLQKELHAQYSCEDILGRSPEMRKLFEILPQVAESSSTVLIEGASGTGKELFARALHNLSPRKSGRFVAVNCAALPDSLLESELFGYKAGAFTDARKDKPGRFLLAQHGTIFLDEIGDISPAMQVRLLRVLQEREIEPLGATQTIPVDVRVIAATNKNLYHLVRKGKFRDDLYYRIRVVALKLPPLCRRREDIPMLVDHLVDKFRHLHNKDIVGVSNEVLAILMNHDFPGNIRELENIIEQGFVLCQSGFIQTRHLPPELRGSDQNPTGDLHPMSLRAMEKHLITESLRRHNGKRSLAARELDIDPSTLYRKMKSYAIEFPAGNNNSNP